MPLSRNDIKSNALKFIKEWENETNEHAEAKSFWDSFFRIFGVDRRRLAAFEVHVKKLDNKSGYIDLFWPGTLIVEHKSKGKSLDKAHSQVLDYFHGIADKQLPKYILVSDFASFRLYDLDNTTQIDFKLTDFANYLHLFDFIAGYQKRVYKEQDPVNIDAALLMGKLHDKLREIGYEGHHLELYLVRLLFCLFADDTGIFQNDIFNDFIELRTTEDGSDLAGRIGELFQVLNTPEDKRYKNLDEALDAFPYVNGKLFEEVLPHASFNREMRQILKECCSLDWGKISPAIFGSLFQSVMEEDKTKDLRRSLGAHYTSEKNILKLIKPLFLDELWKEFDKIKTEKQKDNLLKFHDKISKLKFLDPACGCGNFLIIAYRELRLLEIEIIKLLLFKHEKLRPEVAAEAGYDVGLLIKCEVDKFYGIEYEEFPSQIAQVAMWLIDHQMNQLVTNTFGRNYVRLPLRKSPTIVHANALRTDWDSLTQHNGIFNYILGNPPFIGKHLQNDIQKADMDKIFANTKNAGVLDYVTAWYIKAAQYMVTHPTTKTAFVSTNSVAQGEQVGILWNELFTKYNTKIHFAHNTFNWSNEARGNAAVHVVIIGFAVFDVEDKSIFVYDDIKREPHEIKVRNINPYLIEGDDIVILARTNPICKVPKMLYGSKPVDNGNFFLTDKEREEFLKIEPDALKYIRPILSSHEYLNGKNRWCLWLIDANPSELKKLKLVSERVENIRIFRSRSKKLSVRLQSSTPTLFSELRQPKSNYIIIPRHSSEQRKYIPFGFFDCTVIVSDSCTALPDANLYHFGVLSSIMHNTWMKYTCGRIKSDYRYSNTLVYNNFPWPEFPSKKVTNEVENAAKQILEIRSQFQASTLADLYDPNFMPHSLYKAHQQLDKAVDKCYGNRNFKSEAERMEFLFRLYDRYTSGLFKVEKKRKNVANE